MRFNQFLKETDYGDGYGNLSGEPEPDIQGGNTFDKNHPIHKNPYPNKKYDYPIPLGAPFGKHKRSVSIYQAYDRDLYILVEKAPWLDGGEWWAACHKIEIIDGRIVYKKVENVPIEDLKPYEWTP